MLIDGNVCKKFREDFKEAVKDLEAKYGMIISLGSITYTQDSISVKMTGQVAADIDDLRKKEFEKYCYGYGLTPDDYGATFTDPKTGKEWKIVSIKPKKRSYPIVIQNTATGETAIANLDWIKAITQ